MKIHSIPHNAEAFVIVDFIKQYQPKSLFIVTDDIKSTLKTLEFYSITAYAFPSWDNLPYDTVMPSKSITQQRIKALYNISKRKDSPLILVADSFKSLIQKTIAPKEISKHVIKLSVQETINRENLISALILYGYERHTIANQYGSFAVRGGIIDICCEKNFRIEFFDDVVEIIKEFDIDTQITTHNSSIKNLDIYSLIEKSANNNQLESVLNYLPEVYFIYKVIEDINYILEEIQHNYKSRNSDITPHTLYLTNINNIITDHNSLILSNIYSNHGIKSKYDILTLKTPERIIQYITRNTIDKILICCHSHGSQSRAIKLLQGYGVEGKKVANNGADNIYNGINFTLLPLKKGFISGDFTVITEQDLFGKSLNHYIEKKKKVTDYQYNFEIGMFLIHKEYGIGKFLNLEKIFVDNIYHECLKIEYANNDKMFLPVESMHLITKYAEPDNKVSLDKLGSKAWQTRQAKVKNRIKLIADELLRIAAARKLKKGMIFCTDNLNYKSFCRKFAYTETEEQLEAITKIEEDLSSGRIMDRLVCGDTGFGKTEVAIRAAFIAQQQNHQVVIIVPTTLLCQQHFINLTKRFSEFSVKIVQISRLVDSHKLVQYKKEIYNGEANIIIGTHALFHVQFNNPSLLIIDEEHNFGVKQKEELKKMKNDMHVLSLSATPIPRTLQMSLTGIRDLSLITTPPINRFTSSNFVMKFDEVTIKEAVLREYNRGGGIFYICPHIKNIKNIFKNLTDMFPELKIEIAHSKVNNIEDIISDFYHGKIDILIATPIVQSGLDIPRANTIFIHNAELFGLTQLYQLKGRVGRSNVHSYVYFLVSGHNSKKLEDIKYLAASDNSFSISSYDMDNRGFGNLVGEEQSGHIKEVGIELYQQMLQDAISHYDEVDIKVNVNISTGISDGYIEDFKLRMNLYKRLNHLNCINEIESFAAELIDRFGPIPDETENLLKIVKLQQMCGNANIIKLDITNKNIIISFGKKRNQPEKFLQYIITNQSKFKFINDYTIMLKQVKQTAKHNICLAIQEITKMINMNRET